ncbi:MAG: AAA family ATPase, partial [Acidimicrobiia bacterium]|nr:AAA family ATPase [Acidimicrobiia bacterium]
MADALHTGLWAVLFTDLVDSTALLARVGDEAGASIRQALEQIEVRSINRHDGILVKGTGDGVMAAFTSVVDAIEAAVDIQQRVRRRNHSSEFATDLRIGISVGEVEHDEGDLFGLTVNEAARLCAVADGGEIVISDLVRTLAGSRLHDEVSGPMDHDLKGLPAPVTTWTVRWSPVDPSSEMTLPRGIVADDRFAGRDDDLRVLSESWRDVRSGATAVVMIAGEPGIGKTSLAGHFAARANEDGARVLFGACHDGAVVPFQPFAEAIDGYLTDDPFSSLADGMDELARLVPRSLGVEVTDLPTGEREQYRLFEAVVAWLVELTEQQPVVLVLDDLHWAAAPTVAMLDHVLSARNLERLLVVGTYRDTEVERSHPLASMLAELHKRDAAVRLSLRGLTEVSIADLLEQDGYDTTDGTADRLARVLHDDTAGNPLFLREVLRELRENGSLVEKDGRLSMSRLVDDMGIPQGVRDVIGQRLERLGPDAVPVMRSAAVIGRNFSAGLVQAVSDLDEETVLDVLDRALEARLLRETDRARLQFSHALVRAVLVDEISSGRRQRLHRDVAHALQRARGPDAAAISYHLVEAADVVSPEEVIRAAMAAARQHAAGTTYDLAIAELDRAMAAVEDKAIDGAVE